MRWDPNSSECWARSLGMAQSRLFGRIAQETAQKHFVLVDGRPGSFALTLGASKDFIFEPAPISWAWSSFLRHSLILTEGPTNLFLRIWDKPDDVQKLAVPRNSSEAEAILKKLIAIRRPRTVDAIAKTIIAFKQLRAALSSYYSDNLQVIQLFNLFLEKASNSGVESLNGFNTVQEFARNSTQTSTDYDFEACKDANIELPLQTLTNAAPKGMLPFDTGLLLRHASGNLYQEAHFELERQPYIQGMLFGGRAPLHTERGTFQRDARFTPPEFARTLIEQSLSNLNPLPRDLKILDPACGSGVFLQESLRELEAKQFSGSVCLTGTDISRVSVAIANFCIKQAIKDTSQIGITATQVIEHGDSLINEWGKHHIVLMNPPFEAYKDMSGEDRDSCRNVLGDLAISQFDKSMAFIWKAINSVQDGCVVASVLPSTMLDGSNSVKWREALLEVAEICTVGRFSGYSYFQGAMVEPAFIVLKKRSTGPVKNAVTLVIAEEANEDAAMRALRKREPTAASDGSLYISIDSKPPKDASTWVPRNYRHLELLEMLSIHPCVKDLFKVRQGVLTGNNEAFHLTREKYLQLPQNERKFFHPVAATSTIKNGMLIDDQYLFYPYNTNGLLIASEEELASSVSTFYEETLRGFKYELLKRRDKNEANWWTLTEYRAWQPQFPPKIVTAYFGSAGKFAYDSSGTYVCTHGYAWFWKDRLIRIGVTEQPDAEASDVSFRNSEVAWAYVALLNSKLFEVLLSCFCSRVQGGQFNLSVRYVHDIPIPDLLNGYLPGEIVLELSRIGKAIAIGELQSQTLLPELVSKAYGVPLVYWGFGNEGM